MSGNQNQNSYRYVQLNREVYEDFSIGKLSFDEFILLVWLIGRANPTNGKLLTSYEGLVKELRNKYKKNFVNKILLSLKRKMYVWFPRQQGGRSAFTLELGNYPLKNKTFTNINHRFQEAIGRSQEELLADVPAEELAEVEPVQQKLESIVEPIKSGPSEHSTERSGRSYQNDNDNQKETEISIDENLISVIGFNPKTSEESRVHEIAKELGESDMRFVLSCLRDLGLPVIEQCFGLVKEKIKSGDCKSPGRLFNFHIQKHKIGNGKT